MSYFDTLPEDIMIHINQFIDKYYLEDFKNNIHNVNLELNNHFKNMLKKQYLDYKYDQLSLFVGNTITQHFYDTVIPDIENSEDDMYKNEKFTTVLGDNTCEYFMNIYDKENDIYNLEDWWRDKLSPYIEDWWHNKVSPYIEEWEDSDDE